eukprot:2983275-Pleurochrysis_carterae.AAC.1
MFQKQAIRICLNDELRLLLRHDNHVRFGENSTNYSVTLASETFMYAVTGENDTVDYARGQVGQFDGHFEKSCSRSPRPFSHRSHQRVR